MLYRSLQIAIVNAILLSSWFTKVSAQALIAPATNAVYPSTAKKVIPEDVLYWHFLLYDQRLQQRAEERGQNGKWLASYIEEKVGLDKSQMQIIHQAAADLTTQVAPLKQEALTITQDARTARLAGEATPYHDPAVKERLHELSIEKHQYVIAAISRLNNSLGDQASAALSKYVHGDFAQGFSQVSLDDLRNAIKAKKAVESGEPAK